MPRPCLKVVIGSTRPGRRGPAIASWFHRLATRHSGFDPHLVDLADLRLPLLDEPHPPQRGRYQHEHTRRWSAIADAADAYAFVVPEYNHSYNAATKNALDYLAREWRDKPVAFVSYGGVSGGTRAVQALIPVVTALGMLPLPGAVHIPGIRQLCTPEGTFTSSPGLDESAVGVLDELLRITGAHPRARQTATPVSPVG
ncbi:NADPH-dependent FMN reductase [Streptomyces sp. NPDC090499]|uniref:NADPH-dependent FMN reductase n=1 Tax=unclassified Streptomyces TaxID=2593676 RepID=UPI0038214CFF